ncbi:MAG: hypothetical protein ACREOJ_16165 [Gemmatimonadaceae bacterium]
MVPRTRMGMAAVAGGSALIAGAWLPWMTLFAGLYPMRGIVGLNGRVICAAGIAVLLLGAVLLARDVRGAAIMLSGAGLLLLALAGSIFVGIHQLMAGSGHHTMVVPQAGVGVYVVLLGAVLTAIAPVVARSRRA